MAVYRDLPLEVSGSATRQPAFITKSGNFEVIHPRCVFLNIKYIK